MKLKYLVISDTHLGEPNSILSFPRGLQELWYALRTNFLNKGEDPQTTAVEVENLILLGDIPDRTLSSTSEIQTHTGALLRTLFSALKIKRLVYVIGNHDHTLWTNYLDGVQNPGQDVWDITEPKGKSIIDPDKGRKQDSKAEELLGLFFEYPYGSVWNEIVEGFANGSSPEFIVANPLFSEQFQGRTYVFTHGTFFRPDVCYPESAKSLLKKTRLDSIVADLDINPGEDVRDAVDLRDYERRVYRFVDSLWPSARNNPQTKADRLWVLRRQLRLGAEDARPRPEKTKRIAWKDLKDNPERVTALCGDLSSASDLDLRRGNLDRLQKFAIKPLLGYVDDKSSKLSQSKGLTFVYGDTHDGGFAEVALDLTTLQMVSPKSKGSGNKTINMRIANTGGWLVESTDRHPACHVFAVDDKGAEYILDVSYKDIWIGEDLLLDLADMQVGHKLSRLGRGADRIIDFARKFFKRIA